MRRPLDSARLAGALAARGGEGVVDATDHDGTPVLASIGPVPGTPWYLVARLDTAEISEQLRGSALATFGVVVGVILVGGLLLILFWNWRESRQLRLLYAAEQDLLASETHFRVVFDDAPLGISLTGTDGRLARANTALTRMLGYGEDELDGLTVTELTHPDDREETARLIRPASRATVTASAWRSAICARTGRSSGSPSVPRSCGTRTVHRTTSWRCSRT